MKIQSFNADRLKKKVKGKLHSKLISSDLIDFFPLSPNGKGWGRKSNMKTVKQTAKMAGASVCDVSGTTSPSCKVTRPVRNVHDQLKSIRRRPAVENLQRPVEFQTIPQPWILFAWHPGPVTLEWETWNIEFERRWTYGSVYTNSESLSRTPSSAPSTCPFAMDIAWKGETITTEKSP